MPDEELVLEMYNFAIDYLAHRGYGIMKYLILHYRDSGAFII